MWYTKKKQEVFSALDSSYNGLNELEIKKRTEKYGKNVLKKQKKRGPLRIFFEQFTDFLVMLLIFAAIVSFFVGEYLDATAIIIIVILNGFFGFFQEYKAEKALEALENLSTPSCKVIREGREIVVSSESLVPGDILVLEQGDRIPADAYLLEAMSLQVDESMLTGESIPVKKKVCVLPEKTPLPERKNMLFAGTIITYGRARAIIVSTGMQTEFGKIASMIQVKEEKTPLQKRMEKIGRLLGMISVVICVFIFFVGVVEGENLLESFELAVSLAVSAVPEGLPATITLALTLGVQRMVKRNALMRKLSSVETLGTVDYICTDKTGTITKNEMTVKEVFLNDKTLQVTGSGYTPSGEFIYNNNVVEPSENKQLSLLIKTARLCNNSHLVRDEKWEIIGDPTEGALLVMAAKAGMMKIDKNYPRVKELFFDSNRKMMSTLNKSPTNREFVFVKGAPEKVLEKSTRIMVNNKIKRMNSSWKRKILSQNEHMAKRALRVLAFAYKEYKKGEIESDLIFLGLVGMIDPPRMEVKDALKLCKRAGINVMMITGDQKVTAMAIAEQVGLLEKNKKVLTEQEIEKMSDEELEYVIENVAVCARISPKSKSRIVSALKRKGHIVAVTGDGVNDAPALKRADIGISVGSGTDVTKQASDMVLVDDNFATIVGAVEEGRNIFDNIKKFIKFLLSANFDEILLVFTAFLMKLPTPLLPLQLLWLNLLTDGLPALALGAEPKDPSVMYSKPRDPKENVLKSIIIYSFFAGLLAYVMEVLLFFDDLAVDPVNHVRTLVFTTTVVFEMFLVFSIRTEKFFWQTPMNKYLIMAVIFSIFLQFMAVYYPPFQQILETVPLSLYDWLLIITSCFACFILLELFKYIGRKIPKTN